MTTEKVTAGAQAEAINFKFPFLANPEWLKSFSETPIKFHTTAWNGALGYTAACLQDQADYLKKLAECADPAETLKCHGEFARKSWARSCGEGSRILDIVRANVSSALPGK